MKLHNTLTKKIEAVKPLKDNTIRIYSCGPTVYDHAHIGNLSSFIYADTLRRVLKYNGFSTEHVMNYTDIDDKTLSRSRELYPDIDPMEALDKLTAENIELFQSDMISIGNKSAEPDISFIRATDNIQQMQELISELITKNFAYVTDDGIYFSIDEYKKSGGVYGQLSEVNTVTNAQARIMNDEYDKEAAQDFVLWKAKKEGEPSWDFVVDGKNIPGRPGWHIECSAMSRAKLSQPFDIHTGGVDLIFPHHENEIAQSTAGKTNPTYAKVFVHSEHLLIDNQKMSKSLNNFYTLGTIQEKGFEPLVFRLLCLQAHYRSRAHFSWDNLKAAQIRLQELRAMAALRWQPRIMAHDSGTFALEDVPLQLGSILSEDLNTPAALAYLSVASTQLLTVHIERDMVSHYETMLKGIDDLLGLDLMSVSDITKDQKELIAKREQARSDQDWKEADRIRDELVKQGVGLQDHDHGVIWLPLGS